jgi:hypothetical protein
MMYKLMDENCFGWNSIMNVKLKWANFMGSFKWLWKCVTQIVENHIPINYFFKCKNIGKQYEFLIYNSKKNWLSCLDNGDLPYIANITKYGFQIHHFLSTLMCFHPPSWDDSLITQSKSFLFLVYCKRASSLTSNLTHY